MRVNMYKKVKRFPVYCMYVYLLIYIVSIVRNFENEIKKSKHKNIQQQQVGKVCNTVQHHLDCGMWKGNSKNKINPLALGAFWQERETWHFQHGYELN